MIGRVTLDRSAARVALIGVAVNLFLVALLLAAKGDPAWFVHFGSAEPVSPHARAALGDDVVVAGPKGHDGQVFWAVAHDPLLLDGKNVAADVDRPAYRAQRILYPALVAPWRLAGESALLWGLIITNLVVVLVGGYWAALFARDVGAPARAGIAFALNPLVLYSVVFDFADALALALLVGALLATVRQRWMAAVVAGVAAVLTKETSLLALVAVAVLSPSLPRVRRITFAAIPGAAMVVWALYSRWRLGWPHSDVHEFAAPFAGYAGVLRDFYPERSGVGDIVVAFALIPFAAWSGARWWKNRSLALTAGLPFAALVPFLGSSVLYLSINSLRAIGPAITLLVIDLYVKRGAIDVSPRRAVRAAIR
ncbi:MAG: hypothetical protein QOI95_3124 [Acidimicrobiaceae bacterium]|jgi:hypothetical protein